MHLSFVTTGSEHTGSLYFCLPFPAINPITMGGSQLVTPWQFSRAAIYYIALPCLTMYIKSPLWGQCKSKNTAYLCSYHPPCSGARGRGYKWLVHYKNGEKKSDKAARGHGLLRKEKLWHFSPRKPGVGSQITVVGNVSDYTADPGVMS